MSLLDSIFGTRSGADASKPYLNQIPGIGHENYDPYINAGRDASGKTKSAYESMMDDPTGFINKIMEQYHTSEGYGFAKDKLLKEMSNTSAAGGVAGTPMDQMNQAEGVQGLLSKDMQQFLENVLGRYDTGLKGEEGVASRGFDASKGLTDILGNNLTNQAGLAFNSEQQKNKQTQDLWSMFGKALGGAAGAAGGYMTGGLPGLFTGLGTAFGGGK